MAQLVVIKYVCDSCGVQYEDPQEIFHYEATYPEEDRKIHVEADLCTNCAVAFDVVLKSFRPVPKARRPRRPKPVGTTNSLACDYRDCEFIGKNLQSLGTHKARQNHREKR